MTPAALAARLAGLGELPGSEHSHAIQWWHELAGMGHNTADETPWCGSFVNFITWLLGLECPALPARARSWLTVGLPVALEDAAPGWDVVILSRGSGVQPGPDVIAAPGHVGFFVGRAWDDGIILLGGNQGNRVSVANYPASRVLGVRRLHA